MANDYSIISDWHEQYRQEIRSVRISTDSSLAVSAGEFTACLWDLKSGTRIRSFEGHASAVAAIDLSLNQEWVITGGNDRTLRLWDGKTGECTLVFNGHLDFVNAVRFSHDGRFVYSGSTDCTVRKWDVAHGTCLKVFEGHDDVVTSIDLSRNGNRLVSGSYDNTAKVWDTGTGKCVETFTGHHWHVEAVSIDMESEKVISLSSAPQFGEGRCEVYCWAPQGGRVISELPRDALPIVSAVSIAPYGSMALVAGEMHVQVWDFNFQHKLGELQVDCEEILALAIGWNESDVVFGGWHKNAGRIEHLTLSERVVQDHAVPPGTETRDMAGTASENKANEETPEGRFQRASACFREGRPTEALTLLQNLDQQYPNRPNLIYAMALAQERLGNLDQASKLGRRLRDELDDPRGKQLLEQLGGS